MTPRQLKKLEAEHEKRGYNRYTTGLTSNESWAWFKSFDKERDSDGETIGGYQIAFRVWDYTRYGQKDGNSYGLGFFTSPINTACRVDFTANWEPFEDFDKFEKMAKDFYEMTKKYTAGK